MSVTWSLAGPAAVIGRGAAITIIELRGDVGPLLARLIGAELAVGRVRLCEPANADQMMVARLCEDQALVFPHAGPVLVRRVIATLEAAGATPAPQSMAHATNAPRNWDELESALHAALSRAASPLAIDLLLEQPARWERAWSHPIRSHEHELPADDARRLCRLIEPPLVVALGPPNVGKSSLLNALAGRSVSVVADVPGTTRDHVGAIVNLGGITVRFIDAPGLAASGAIVDAIQHEAQRLAVQLAATADLVLWCGDGQSGFLDERAVGLTQPRLRVGLRADLGGPGEPVDVRVSAKSGEGIGGLIEAVGEALVPRTLREDPRAWAFWLAAGR